jgi:hypothetical protein
MFELPRNSKIINLSPRNCLIIDFNDVATVFSTGLGKHDVRTARIRYSDGYVVNMTGFVGEMNGLKTLLFPLGSLRRNENAFLEISW